MPATSNLLRSRHTISQTCFVAGKSVRPSPQQELLLASSTSRQLMAVVTSARVQLTSGDDACRRMSGRQTTRSIADHVSALPASAADVVPADWPSVSCSAVRELVIPRWDGASRTHELCQDSLADSPRACENTDSLCFASIGQ